MSKNPIAISPDKTLKEAATIMHDRSVHRLPVLDGTDQVIGILTRGDIIRQWQQVKNSQLTVHSLITDNC